jgi:hypothetical protein
MKDIQSIIVRDRIYTVDHPVLCQDFTSGVYEVASIRKEAIWIAGDPFDHYVGRDHERNVIFQINCRVPCEVLFIPLKK